jgi:SAM-dependent methyltransferase
MDLSRFATNLRLTEPGLWTSGAHARVSFPAGGHDECMGVEDSSFWFRHRNACLLEIFRALPPGGTVFEVGGGNGFVAQALTRAGYETVLLEPGPDGARNALARGLETVVCSTFEAAAFRDGSIPAAGMFDVLEHSEDDVAFLGNVHRALAPGGRFYVTVPAYPALWSAEDEHAGHFRRYTAGGLRTRLANTGFGIERITYFFAPLVLPILLLRALPRRLGLASGGAEAIDAKARRHHAPGPGPGERALGALLALELAQLRQGARIPIGSSCLAVARKR